MHKTPVPKPGNKDATAKFTVEFSDGLTVAGYLFTNGLAPDETGTGPAKDYVIPGTAWIGGNLHLPGGKAVRRAAGRAHWISAARGIREDAGYPARFTSGRVIVPANEGHGTRQAEASFATQGNLLAALEDALALAGWTLITGGQRRAAERQVLVDAGLRADDGAACSGHEPEPELLELELTEAQEALRDHLIGVARELDPDSDTNTLVMGLPGYKQVRDTIDPDERWWKGPHVTGMGDDLRAISAYDRAHGAPTVTALVKRARSTHPAAGWWGTDDEMSWDEMVASWREAVREAVTYWHAPETIDCEPAVAALPARWRALADMTDPIKDAQLATAWRMAADELDAALPTPSPTQPREPGPACCEWRQAGPAPTHPLAPPTQPGLKADPP
jgi:hypothetical protein